MATASAYIGKMTTPRGCEDLFIQTADHVDFLTTGKNSPAGHPQITVCTPIGSHWPEERVPMKTASEGAHQAGGRGWGLGGCVWSHMRADNLTGSLASPWILEALQNILRPPFVGQRIHFSSFLPSSQAHPLLSRLTLPAWGPLAAHLFPRPAICPRHRPRPAAREPPSDPPPASRCPHLSPVWLRSFFARCSLPGIPLPGP